MPRKARMYIEGTPCHVVQRGNNRNACFFSEQDYEFYLKQLGDACRRYKVDLHAYVLMTNHTHLLMTPTEETGISRVMQSLGRCYVQYVNRAYHRTGTLWESRHKSNLVDSEHYLLACYRYIEMNPVRAGMVGRPADYRWSSYRAHAYGETNCLISDHILFSSQHADANMRRKIYCSLFEMGEPESLLKEIRTASSFSMPLGNSKFRKQVEEALGRKLGHSTRGRPIKLKKVT